MKLRPVRVYIMHDKTLKWQTMAAWSDSSESVCAGRG